MITKETGKTGSWGLAGSGGGVECGTELRQIDIMKERSVRGMGIMEMDGKLQINN